MPQSSAPIPSEPAPQSSEREPPSGDPLKDKFRAALERKRSQQAERHAADENRDGSKIHSEHAAAHAKRTFRRKSG